MTCTLSVREIIDLWPSRADLAAEISVDGDRVTPAQVAKWAQRGSVPAAYHGRLVRAAARIGSALTAEALDAAHDTFPPIQEDAA